MMPLMARTGSLAALGVVGLVPCAGARWEPPGRLRASLSPCSGCAHMSVSDMGVRVCARVGSACLCSAAPGGRWRTAASLDSLSVTGSTPIREGCASEG